MRSSIVESTAKILRRGGLPRHLRSRALTMMKRSFLIRLERAGLTAICLWMLACQQKMADQPRYEPLQKSNFFDDQRSSRPLSRARWRGPS